MNMMLMELLIIASVIIYTTRYALKEQDPKALLKKFLFCAIAAWVSEESSIILYGFYAYSPVWNLFIADVPLVVVIVWPALIHSATVLASQLLSSPSRLMPLIAGCIVLADAMLIEPVSVNFNLWLWYKPGLYGVPLIGLLGWSYFSFFAAIFYAPENRPRRIKSKLPYIIAVPVIGTHLLLVISYWIFFKWTLRPINPIYSSGFVWIVSTIISIFFIVTKTGQKIELKALLLRIPAAIFFYALLLVKQNSPMSLVVFSLAFIPPYIVLSANSFHSNLGTE